MWCGSGGLVGVGLFSLKKSVCYQFLHCKITFHDSTQSYQTTYKTK